MARKITRDAIKAFIAGENFTRDNTDVAVDVDGSVGLYLHGNQIANRSPNGNLFIRTCGWETVTTKERLNGLPGVQVYTHKHVLHLNGKVWEDSSQWTPIG